MAEFFLAALVILLFFFVAFRKLLTMLFRQSMRVNCPLLMSSSARSLSAKSSE